MTSLRLTVLTLLTCFSIVTTDLPAHELTGSAAWLEDKARQVGNGALGAARTIVLPQAVPSTPINVEQDLSCAQIYDEIRYLTPQTYDYSRGYWDDPRNQSAAFIGTMFTPGFYFLGYTAVTDYFATEKRAGSNINLRLDALRQESARQMCFVR